jgi:hypothetical protein
LDGRAVHEHGTKSLQNHVHVSKTNDQTVSYRNTLNSWYLCNGIKPKNDFYAPVKQFSRQFESALPFIFSYKNEQLFSIFPCYTKEIRNVNDLNGQSFFLCFMPWHKYQELKVIFCYI